MRPCVIFHNKLELSAPHPTPWTVSAAQWNTN